MDSNWLTVLLSDDRWLFIEYFLGFVESVCVFYTSLCACCSPPWPLLPAALFRHAHRYFFKFFCTQENSSPFPSVLKWCALISLFTPPFHKLKLSIRTSSSVCSVLSTCDITFSFPLRFVSASPESLAVFLCFIKCPYSTETVIGVFEEHLHLG